jgi:histidine phosphotransferase ChpT
MSNTFDDLRLSELLCARLCHDLSGPVGAAAAGSELLADSGDAETLSLVSTSASAAAARLAFLRQAFGFGTQPQRGGSVRDLVERYFASLTQGAPPQYVLVWQLGEGDLSADAARMVLNLVMTVRDALPRGGTVTVSGHPAQTGAGAALTVEATGDGAQLTAEARAVLTEDAEATGPRGAQAQLLRILSQRMGLALMVEVAPSRIVLSLE